MDTVSLAELLDLARSPAVADLLGSPTGGGAVLVTLDGAGRVDADDLRRLAAIPLVLIGVGPAAAAVDVVAADEAAAGALAAAVAARPVAATTLALLLRGGDARDLDGGLVAESTAYSMLQAGAEHQTWLAAHPRRDARRVGTPVRVERDGSRLHITLTRPEVRNAYAAATRDALLDALAVAVDAGVKEVVLDGEGPSFCSGGDLDEFGTAADPATANLLRLARSAARAVAGIADRLTVRVHGACVGAGVELPAFASRVVAAADATFRLPEVGMGLVPGAGGTVSIPRRIGRQRAMGLALTGEEIDAETALAWGLVDEIASVR